MSFKFNMIVACAAGMVLSSLTAANARKELNVPEEPGYIPTKAELKLPAKWRPQPVFFRTSEKPGTIVIHTNERFLYLVQGNGRAIRYGVGVGREGFEWQGVEKVTRKKEWPDWRPPASMIKRQPYLPRFMAGGPGNPLGARALYLGTTEYRIHGTNKPQTIGHAMSSGCIRMINPDVMNLFAKVPVGTRVIVRQAARL